MPDEFTRTLRQRAEEVLRSMATSGYVDVDNEPGSGVVIYRFPELEGRRLSERRDLLLTAGDILGAFAAA